MSDNFTKNIQEISQEELFNEIKFEIEFNKYKLIPVIAQCIKTKNILMLAYMSEESLKKSLETGLACYWSRSREKLWTKGETSGNIQKIIELYLDCDGDSLLILVEQVGGITCHTGKPSCFFRKLKI